MNRLFGAKNTAPKPTLNQAIEGVCIDVQGLLRALTSLRSTDV
jgi:hypothetical protein